jgi:hypothetical protein
MEFYRIKLNIVPKGGFMKFLKYAILSLLIITICKKITPYGNNSYKERKKSIPSYINKYDDFKKIATIGNTTFVGVYEYDPAQNPISPTQKIPAMVPFGTIHVKTNSDSTEKFQSRFKKTIPLYGIPVDGHRKPIRKAHTHKVLGFMWHDQDKVKDQVYGLGVAQFHSGETYVGVKAVHLPNYIEDHKNPHYNPDEQDFISLRYGIKQLHPTVLGTAKLGSMRYSGPYKRQTYMIYGVQLPDLKELYNKNNPDLLNRNSPVTYPIIAYHAIQKYLQTKKNTSQEQSSSQSTTTNESLSHRTAAAKFFNPLI